MQNAFYFQHDYNASNDHKILFLRQQLGIEGYGIYWYVVEQLAQSGGKLPLKIIPVLAMQIQTPQDKVVAVIKNYDLFTIEDDIFFSMRLMKQIQFRETLSIEGKKGAMARWGKNQQIDTENSPPISPPIGAPNAKERKGKERKEKKVSTSAGKPATIAYREKMFYETLKPFLKQYGKDTLRAFFNYWTEKSINGKKMRFEKEKVFEPSKRLATWKARESDGKFKQKPTEEAPKTADYSYAENMRDMKKEEWEKLFRGKLETDNEFRKHFGYEELPID
jgi:hypothetical protein